MNEFPVNFGKCQLLIQIKYTKVGTELLFFKIKGCGGGTDFEVNCAATFIQQSINVVRLARL